MRHSLATGATILHVFLICSGHMAAQVPPPPLATLYSFSGAADGYTPAALALGGDGVLYGVSEGGSHSFGTVFSLTRPVSPLGVWNKNVLYNFTGGSHDGIEPIALALGNGGVLYGTTRSGGANGFGIIFSLTPPATAGAPWAETVLYNFAIASSPTPGLTIGSDGVLYGTTYRGGTSKIGAVYSLDPPLSPGEFWTQTVLYSFKGGLTDGFAPSSGVVIGSGPGGSLVLYGTTGVGGAYGGGTLYSLTAPANAGGLWNERVLANFDLGGKTVFKPAAPVVIDGGALFGTLEDGGYTTCTPTPTPVGCGGLFAAIPSAPGGPWTTRVLYKFSATGDDTDGQNPSAGLVLGLGGVLYGTTYEGGTSNLGTVYSFTPPLSPGGAWTEKVLHSFTAGKDGSLPGSLVADPNTGVIYGFTGAGGTSNFGTVFSLTP